jgi:peptidoglycan/xylan/chitin deacetylase (PgdA/CDA1 family)
MESLVPPSPLRAARVLLCAVVLLAGGCGAKPKPAPAAAASPLPVASSPAGSASASPSVTPSPSHSPSARPTPTRTTAGSLHCGSTVPLVRAQARGSGPAGSVSVTGTQNVALTFDDGPDPYNTPKLLDMLRQCGVKATFCLVGFRARNHPELVARIAAEGHTLCNHSWQHLLDLAAPAHTDDYIRHDLQATNAVILRAAPQAKIRYFRAPGGNFTPRLVQIAKDLGMTSIYWSLDPRDWESTKYGTGSAMVSHVISAVQSNVRPGSIVLSHDNGKPTTITAYRTLLPWLKARFRLIPLPT